MNRGALFCLLFFTLSSFAQKIPIFSETVYDENNWVTSIEKAQLDHLIRGLYKSGGPQIQIMFVANLQGYTIEDYSIKTAEKIKMGKSKEDNGIILIVAKKERKIRIEVGGGIEGTLTDYESFKIIKTILTPSFQSGKFFQGSANFVYEIAKIFNIKIDKEFYRPKKYNSNQSLGLVAFILFFFLLIIQFFTNNILFRGILSTILGASLSFFIFGLIIHYLIFFTLLSLIIGLIGPSNLLIYSSGYGGGRSGGYGGGSGGWSGGGGGFSGGGSSGSF